MDFLSTMQAVNDAMSEARFKDAEQTLKSAFEHISDNPAVPALIALWGDLIDANPDSAVSALQVRDRLAVQVANGTRDPMPAVAVIGLNKATDHHDDNVAFFRALADSQPILAANCFSLVLDSLLESGASALANRFLDDPEAAIRTAAAAMQDQEAMLQRMGSGGAAHIETLRDLSRDKVERLVRVLELGGRDAEAMAAETLIKQLFAPLTAGQ